MSNRWCPRCHHLWEEQMFVEPLAICLSCYGRNPGNQGLSFDVLIDKASRSRYARRRKNKSDADAYGMAIRNYQLSKKPISQETQLALEKMPCDYCNEEFEYNDENIIGLTHHGENKLCCRGCLAGALTDGASVLQQVRTPIHAGKEGTAAMILARAAGKKLSND